MFQWRKEEIRGSCCVRVRGAGVGILRPECVRYLFSKGEKSLAKLENRKEEAYFRLGTGYLSHTHTTHRACSGWHRHIHQAPPPIFIYEGIIAPSLVWVRIQKEHTASAVNDRAEGANLNHFSFLLFKRVNQIGISCVKMIAEEIPKNSHTYMTS